MYFDSRSQYSGLGAMVTNEAWFAGVGNDRVLIELVGEDSFTASPYGFFRVHYLGGPGIEVVRMSFPGSTTNLDIRSAWFDMDDGPLNGYSGVGRGWDPVNQVLQDLPGCNNTFRQESDITCGLVYAETYDYPAPLDGNNPVPQYVPGSYDFSGFDSPACNYYTDELGFEFRSGLTGTADWVTSAYWFADDLGDVIFQFDDFDDPGDVFRWDCDTDGIRPQEVPASGEQHQGLNVTVIFADGEWVNGDLLPDPHGGRALIGW